MKTIPLSQTKEPWQMAADEWYQWKETHPRETHPSLQGHYIEQTPNPEWNKVIDKEQELYSRYRKATEYAPDATMPDSEVARLPKATQVLYRRYEKAHFDSEAYLDVHRRERAVRYHADIVRWAREKGLVAVAAPEAPKQDEQEVV